MAETASDMITMLRRHYLPEGRQPGGIFAAEIVAPNANRRADLIWQGLTAGSGYELVGHEVKVNRADLLAELADPTKSDPWQRYCNRWWLVIPHEALLDGLELPPTWGVLTPPSGRRTRTCTVSRPAPDLRPRDQGPAFLTLASWLHWRYHETSTSLKSTTDQLQREREYVQRLQEQIPAEGPAVSAEREVVSDIIRRLGGARYGEIGDWHTRLDVDDVVAALTDLGSVQKKAEVARESLRHRRDELRRLGDRIQRLLTEDAASALRGGGQ